MQQVRRRYWSLWFCTVAVLAGVILAGGCASPVGPAPNQTSSASTDTPPSRSGLVEAFPGIRLSRESRTLEFQSVVPIDARTPAGVLLESIVCTPDTREHESLLMTTVRPSHIHAALLRLGLQPGRPARFDFRDGKLVAIDPIGPRLRVSLRWVDADGIAHAATPNDWVIDASTGEHLPRGFDGGGWVFAGSGSERTPTGYTYHADTDGTLISLAAFGSETIAYAQALSPESAYADRVWIADPQAVPPRGQSVTVRIEPVEIDP
jgi:hypothetical protein